MFKRLPLLNVCEFIQMSWIFIIFVLESVGNGWICTHRKYGSDHDKNDIKKKTLNCSVENWDEGFEEGFECCEFEMVCEITTLNEASF